MLMEFEIGEKDGGVELAAIQLALCPCCPHFWPLFSLPTVAELAAEFCCRPMLILELKLN